MPEKDAGLLAQGVAAFAALLTIAFAFVKSINLSRDVRDFKKEVSSNMTAQNAKLLELDERQDEVEKVIPIESAKSKAYHLQMVKSQDTMASQIKDIFGILTEMRNEEVRELKARVKELEK